MTTEYQQQAETFLAKHGIKFRATLSDSKNAPWQTISSGGGHHYRITLSKAFKTKGIYASRLTFDFWASHADREAGNKEASAYDVLACISGDVHTPETFEEFCGDFGYNTDSIEALQTFRRCSRFAKQLREFFSTDEIGELSEIN